MHLPPWARQRQAGVHELFPNPEVYHSCWKVFAGLRNSADLLQKYVGAWVAEHLHFEDPSKLASVEDRVCLWGSLGMPRDMVDAIAGEMQLAYSAPKLLVPSALRGDSHIIDKVASSILGL
eukprot:1323459-Lingulodinium_polyedra.AAC.1